MIKFWARIILAITLAIVGTLLATYLPGASSTQKNELRLIYAILGFLTGVLVFSRLTSWVVTTTTKLFSKLILRIASEVINQFTHLASSGLPFLSSNTTENKDALFHPTIIDTSALIDGRMIDVAAAGFLYGVALIPNFVLTELQQVADSADDVKRARGRRGFEVIDQLKKVPNVKVVIWDKLVKGSTVDDQLIRLGKILKGKILTCDYNLNRVASVSGVGVLNVNELANALKTVAIPGEKLKLKLIHAGKDKTQGVGYLGDGTMVVVAEAVDKVGDGLEVEVTKVLQSPTGRMIFAKILR